MAFNLGRKNWTRQWSNVCVCVRDVCKWDRDHGPSTKSLWIPCERVPVSCPESALRLPRKVCSSFSPSAISAASFECLSSYVFAVNIQWEWLVSEKAKYLCKCWGCRVKEALSHHRWRWRFWKSSRRQYCGEGTAREKTWISAARYWCCLQSASVSFSVRRASLGCCWR